MKRRRPAPEPALPEAVLDVLLFGWADWPIRHRDPSYDWLQPYDVPRDAWPALYAEHCTFIEAEARRRGLARSWAAEQFTDHQGDQEPCRTSR